MGLEKLHEYTTFKTDEELRETVATYLADYQLNTSARLVLEYITACAMRYSGACTIYRETIAEKIGMTVITVARALKKLRELKMIDIIPSYRRSINGGRGASIYQILPNDTQDDIQDDTQAPPEKSQGNPLLPALFQTSNHFVSLFFISSLKPLKPLKQLSGFTDSLIYDVFLESKQISKSLFNKIVAEVKAKEQCTRIVNHKAYLRAAVANAIRHKDLQNPESDASKKQALLKEEMEQRLLVAARKHAEKLRKQELEQRTVDISLDELPF
ncbi:helix-turn-helix domain-containing protein [Listeria booriae]|uniref:Helix-turn-helix domain-containing protein n=1 Tax=Listeria booriae TaxID=1552123 RepID=A0A7X1CCV4_9LIST|nr:helix-turn-helix domain-containing protein [Listeria booriae]MBC1492754.1 hypothetical protein [Listeria booriae]MDT0112164.1 helix-turn-helix domain-containing protein [Listeria booriae]